MSRHIIEDDSYGPRCICGHYLCEHDSNYGPPLNIVNGCRGAYATLAADADDDVSVEVGCHCNSFCEADREFEVR